ncbi:MAG: tRNA-intron lyase [archaeon]
MAEFEKITIQPFDLPEEPEPKEKFGRLRGDKAILPEGGEFFERGGFGELVSDGLELSAEETLYLFQKGKISIVSKEDRKIPDFDALLSELRKFLPEIYIRYQLYRDLRERGYVVRSGLKYGTHFRVYDRGVKPSRGERESWEHAKYLAHAIPEAAVYSISELSRFVRLSHSVRKTLWLGVVDGEGDVTYFQITRATP